MLRKGRFIAFQIDTSVAENGSNIVMRARTLEEAIAYENFALLRAGTISVGITIPADLSEAYGHIYDRVHSKSFKKTDFAMNLLACKENWTVPSYIAEGLKWLESRICPPIPIPDPANAPATAGGEA